MLKKLFLWRINLLLLNDQPKSALKLLSRYIKWFGHDGNSTIYSSFIYLRLDLFDIYEKQLPIVSKILKDDISLYVLKGVAFQRKKEYVAAIEILTKGIDLVGGSSNAHNNRGYCYLFEGEYKKAIRDFDKAIDLDNKDYFAYNNRGLAKIKLHDKSGISDIRRSLKGFDNNAIAYKNLALWEFYFGDKSRIPKIIDKCKIRAYYSEIKNDVAEIEEMLI